MKTTNLAGLYHLPDLQWADIRDRLGQGFPQAPESGGPNRHSCWLSTINPDGSPHLTGLGMLWAHDAFWFETGESTRKARNLARDPRCALSLATDAFDLTVEGSAEKISDPDTVADMVARWAAQGWPARVDESGQAITADYSAPSAGPPPWFVYRITLQRATAIATVAPGGATRWDFR
jgi:PPOX class probable F420-dependent enzyme